MLNSWQRLIVAFATITLNLTAIAQVEAQSHVSTEATDDDKNTCLFRKLIYDDSFFAVRTFDPKININVIGSTILRPGREIGRLNLKNKEEREEIQEAQEKIIYIIENLNSIRKVTETDLKNLADEISKLYLYSGYITSKVQKVHLVYTDTTEKTIINIYISEGYLSEIIINKVNKQNENSSKIRNRVSNSYICSRILQAVDTPINITKLEEQLQLMSSNPLFESVEADLEAVGTTKVSKLIVKVVEANPFNISLSADNYSPPSIGSQRLGVNLRYLNLLRIQDEISASYLSSTTGGAELFDFSYKIPLNPKNGTLLFRAAPNNTEVTQSPFDELGIEGEKEVYEFTYRQPLVRELREEFALSLGFSYQEGQTFLGDVSTPFGIGPDEDGFSRTSTIQFTQDYTNVDSGGIWSLRSQFNFGIGLFNATTNDPPIPDGHFFIWFAQLQRGQRLSQGNLLVIQTDLQLTPNSLLPAQQFIIGGGQSLRGYRQNVRSGDNGFRFSVEDRITVLSGEEDGQTIQLAPFLDLGAVWNKPNNPNKLLDEQFLIGVGLGLQWKNFIGIKGLDLRFDYGIPLVEIKDRGNNIQDDGLYFQVNYQP